MSKKPMFEDFEIEDNSKTMTLDQFLDQVKEMFGEPETSIQEKTKLKNEFDDMFKRING